MRKILVLLSFIFQSCWLFGQNNTVTKTELVTILKTTNNCKNQLPKTDNYSREWYIKNNDSAFYKNDTLKVYNDLNIIYRQENSCIYKQWIFSKRNNFSQAETNACQEPPITQIEFNYNVLLSKGKKFKEVAIAADSYKIIEKDGQVFIITYKEKVIFETYKVITLKKFDTAEFDDESFELIVERQKKKIEN